MVLRLLAIPELFASVCQFLPVLETLRCLRATSRIVGLVAGAVFLLEQAIVATSVAWEQAIGPVGSFLSQVVLRGRDHAGSHDRGVRRLRGALRGHYTAFRRCLQLKKWMAAVLCWWGELQKAHEAFVSLAEVTDCGLHWLAAAITALRCGAVDTALRGLRRAVDHGAGFALFLRVYRMTWAAEDAPYSESAACQRLVQDWASLAVADHPASSVLHIVLAKGHYSLRQDTEGEDRLRLVVQSSPLWAYFAATKLGVRRSIGGKLPDNLESRLQYFALTKLDLTRRQAEALRSVLPAQLQGFEWLEITQWREPIACDAEFRQSDELALPEDFRGVCGATLWCGTNPEEHFHWSFDAGLQFRSRAYSCNCKLSRFEGPEFTAH